MAGVVTVATPGWYERAGPQRRAGLAAAALQQAYSCFSLLGPADIAAANQEEAV